MNNHKLFRIFSIVAIAEGISFLVLLLIAMPLKYWAGLPMAVKLVGWAHGVLFVAFLWLAFETGSTLKKKFSWFIKAFAASVIPCGTFIFDRQFKKELALNPDL